MPAGYPSYSSLLGHYSKFQTFRRFRNVRMRMILLKQDQISRLEEELNEVDQAEAVELYLGSCRRDQNHKREDVLRRLDEAFSAYGTY